MSFITEDGSVTLIHPSLNEAYHSQIGARTEAEQLYRDLSGLLAFFTSKNTCKVLDLGLGLGYNALVTLCAWLDHEDPSDLELLSLESDRELWAQFLSKKAPWQKDWSDRWLSLVPAQVETDLPHPKTKAKARWVVKIEDALFLDLSSLEIQGFHFIWQDFFSPKSSPLLWSEVWFRQLKTIAAPESCVLMTYSVAGMVKEALLNSGWWWQKIPSGFVQKKYWLKAYSHLPQVFEARVFGREFLGKTDEVDGDFLLLEALGYGSQKDLMLYGQRFLTEKEWLIFLSFLRQRKKDRKPLAYICGYQDFYGLRFFVDERVLIPRSATETLAEQALSWMSQQKAGPILDLGTGSGALILTLLTLGSPDWTAEAWDISQEALDVAEKNRQQLNISQKRLRFVLKSMEEAPSHGPFQLIVSNPPYIDRKEKLSPDVLCWEPHQALFAEDKGLYFYQVITSWAFKVLTQEGALMLEVGHKQASQVLALFARQGGYSPGKVICDLSRHRRVLIFRKKSTLDCIPKIFLCKQNT